MFYPDQLAYEQPARMNFSRNLLLSAIPLILFLAFLSGGTAFFIGSRAASPSTERQAKLPVASDKRNTPVTSTTGSLAPLVSIQAAATKPLAPVTTNDEGNWVRIPALKVEVPLVKAVSMSDEDILAALGTGVALYPNGVQPGQDGNAFIAGHSTGEPWKGSYRFAFLSINKLKKGDSVLVDYEGTRYTYVVSGSHIINPQTIPTLKSEGKEPTLSLMACWPLWTSKNRMIIDTKLAAINPLNYKGLK